MVSNLVIGSDDKLAWASVSDPTQGHSHIHLTISVTLTNPNPNPTPSAVIPALGPLTHRVGLLPMYCFGHLGNGWVRIGL